MIRLARWVYMLYSTFQTVTSAWFLLLCALAFTWWVASPIIQSWLTNDETDGIP